VAEGDLQDAPSLEAAARGVSAVIHCAGLSGMWGPLSDYVETNLMGTARVLAAARRQKVGLFIYTSSPSVVHSGASLNAIDESAPYSLDISQPYAYSKMLAERLVLSENRPGMKSLALRPHLIWGPGDPHILPRLVERAKAGRLFLFSGEPKVDSTFIDNAALAHVLALEKLEAGAPVDGQAYFIAQDEPMELSVLVNRLLKAAGAPMVKGRLSPRIGLWGARALELIWRLANKSTDPPLTVFTVRQMSTSHFFNLSKAKSLLGYAPAVTTAQGLAKLAESLASA
jgi:nucleoside-diphosphate-sugar epimerase